MKARGKITISIIVLIAILTASVFAVFALIKKPEESSYVANFSAKQDVYAKINGSSYISTQTTPIETLNQTIFDGNVVDEEKSVKFGTEIKAQNATDTIDFVYTIQNTTELLTYSALFIEPTVSVESDNISCDISMKVEGEYLEVTADEYIVLERNETATIKFTFSGNDIINKIDYTMNFNLFNERELVDCVKVVYADKNDFTRIYKGSTYKLSDIWKIPAETGKIFAGWYTDISLTQLAPTNLSGEVRLFAKFENV